MIAGLLTLVGSPILRVVGVVSAVILISWLLIQYGASTQEQGQEIQRLQGNIQTMERIDEAIRNTPSNVDGANSLLDQFLDSRR